MTGSSVCVNIYKSARARVLESRRTVTVFELY